MKLYVEEEGSDLIKESAGTTALLATSVLAYVEARAAFARRRHGGGIRPGDYRRIVERLDEDWMGYVRVEAAEPLLRQAAALAETHRLRAYDAIHLASALFVTREAGGPLILASWDAELERAARREGIESLRTRRPAP